MRFVIGFLILLVLGSLSVTAHAQSNMYTELRQRALKYKATEIGITKEKFPGEVFGLLVEQGLSKGSYTLSGFVDGNASIYFSNGGGIIGGIGHAEVRSATKRLIEKAQLYYQRAKKVAQYPTPRSDEVLFYFKTYEGVRVYSISLSDLRKGNSGFTELFIEVQNVISEFRKIDQKR